MAKGGSRESDDAGRTIDARTRRANIRPGVEFERRVFEWFTRIARAHAVAVIGAAETKALRALAMSGNPYSGRFLSWAATSSLLGDACLWPSLGVGYGNLDVVRRPG
jgi:hypothetical protein